MSDLDVLKDIPGYKAILKSVLKSQIQLLIQQLSEHAGEESIILTASVHDGTLSHLGSSNGKGFLEGRDEIKSQFLGYCLKTYHKQKTHEPQKPYQRTHPSPRTPSQMTGPFPKRSRMPSATFSESSSIGYLPVSQTAPSEMSDFDSEMPKTRSEVHCTDTRIKTEHIDNQSEESVTGSFGNVPLPPARDTYQKTAGSSATGQYSSGDSGVNTPSVDPDAGSENLEGNDTDSSNVSAVKVEQVEDELEITGVELAAAGWSQGQAGFGTDSDTSFSQAGDQSGYMAMSESSKEFPDFEPVYSKDGLFCAFPCPVCKKAFNLKGNLKKHYALHIGFKPFVCVECGKAFTQKITLIKHTSAMHGCRVQKHKGGQGGNGEHT